MGNRLDLQALLVEVILLGRELQLVGLRHSAQPGDEILVQSVLHLGLKRHAAENWQLGCEIL